MLVRAACTRGATATRTLPGNHDQCPLDTSGLWLTWPGRLAKDGKGGGRGLLDRLIKYGKWWGKLKTLDRVAMNREGSAENLISLLRAVRDEEEGSVELDAISKESEGLTVL